MKWFGVKCVGLRFQKKKKRASVQQGRGYIRSLGTKPKLNSKGETVTTKRNQEPENVFAELKSKCGETDRALS